MKLTKYVVRLNDKYMTEYDEETGYNDFGGKDKAIRFDAAHEALGALVDVVWGGTDNPPEIVEVEEELDKKIKAYAVVDERGEIHVDELGKLSVFVNANNAKMIVKGFNGTDWAKRNGKKFRVVMGTVEVEEKQQKFCDNM